MLGALLKKIKRVPVAALYVLSGLVLLATSAPPVSVLAITQDQQDALNLGIYYFNTEADRCPTTNPVTPGNIETTAAQNENAKIVIGIAKTLVTDNQQAKKAALIGLMVGLAESNLRNYANDGTFRNKDGVQPYIGTQLGPISQGLPHDAVGNDNDSVGIMQQRAVDGHWGPVDPARDLAGNIKWLMTPAYAAEAFFAMPAGKGDRKALLNVSGWETMDPALAAQAVQVSFDQTGQNYRNRQTAAQSLIDQFYDTSPSIPLPVPLAGAGDAPKSESSGLCGPAVSNSKILAKILEYAWPDYRPSNGRAGNPVEKKPEYEAAVRKGGYNGDPCFGGGVDCGAFVTHVMRDSGADPDYNPKSGNTTSQLQYLQENSGPGGKYVLVPPDKLLPGDIAIRKEGNGLSGHTYFFVGSIKGIDGTAFNGPTASASQCGRAPMAGPEDTRSLYSWYRLIK